MKKLILTAIAIGFGALGFFVYDLLTQTTGNGVVTILVVDANDTVIYEEEHAFTEDDTLFSLLQDNFDLTCANNLYQASDCTNASFFGTVILGIDDLQTDWTTDYIAIYINDDYSGYGVDGIQLKDGDVYRFEYTLVEELTR